MQGYEINPNEKIEVNNSYIQNHTNSILMVCDNDVGESFEEHEYYPDLVSYAPLGEDIFPAVVDKKGNATGGTLVNGSGNDFKDIPVVQE